MRTYRPVAIRAAITWVRVWRRSVQAARRLRRHPTHLQERLEQIDRHRKDRRRIVIGRDFGERLQIAQLQRDRTLAHDLGGLGEALGGLKFTLRGDDLGAPFAFSLGLRRDRALHILRQIDVLELDQHDLDTPRLGLRVDDFLDFGVELFALAQQVVELGLSADRSQRGLRKLHRAVEIVADLGHRARRIDHAKVQHGADLDRDVVARDDVLRRDVEGHRAQIDAHRALEDRDDEDNAGAAKRT